MSQIIHYVLANGVLTKAGKTLLLESNHMVEIGHSYDCHFFSKKMAPIRITSEYLPLIINTSHRIAISVVWLIKMKISSSNGLSLPFEFIQCNCCTDV